MYPAVQTVQKEIKTFTIYTEIEAKQVLKEMKTTVITSV
jgi:hypothetical protein